MLDGRANEVINQHHVPRMYLKRFALDASEDSSMLRVLSKSDGRLFQANVANLAVERYFYDRSGPQGTEAALAELESAASPLIDRLVHDDGLRPLDVEESRTVATFVALLDFRTAAFRRAAVGLATSVDGLGERVATELGARYESTAPQAPEEVRAFHKALMWRTAAVAREVMASMQWTVLVAPADVRFVTSDHPVVKFNPLPPPAPWMGTLGWNSPGVQVLVPLSPQTCLAIVDAAEAMPSRATYSAEGVLMANGLQASYAHRFIFGSRDSELTGLEERMQLHPKLREGGLTFESAGLLLRQRD